MRRGARSLSQYSPLLRNRGFVTFLLAGTLSFAAATPLLRSAVRAASGPSADLKEGPFYALDPDWGARVACYALLAVGLRNAERLGRAATFIQHLDGAEAAWWLGLMTNGGKTRAVRALRILTEAVE